MTSTDIRALEELLGVRLRPIGGAELRVDQLRAGAGLAVGHRAKF